MALGSLLFCIFSCVNLADPNDLLTNRIKLRRIRRREMIGVSPMRADWSNYIFSLDLNPSFALVKIIQHVKLFRCHERR
jgi:hypothetical protein